MCQVQMLCRNEAGYVSRCRCCGEMTVAFHTLLLRLGPKDFSALLQSVSSQVETGASMPDRELPAFICRTDSSKVRMRLSYNQLSALEQLMSEAAMEGQLRDILQQE